MAQLPVSSGSGLGQDPSLPIQSGSDRNNNGAVVCEREEVRFLYEERPSPPKLGHDEILAFNPAVNPLMSEPLNTLQKPWRFQYRPRLGASPFQARLGWLRYHQDKYQMRKNEERAIAAQAVHQVQAQAVGLPRIPMNFNAPLNMPHPGN